MIAPLLNDDVILLGLLLALLVEALTSLFRFRLGLRTLKDTPQKLRDLTGGVRVHHGYLGVAGIVLAPFVNTWTHRAATVIAVASIALFLSDLIHHFLVLWPITGHPRFHFIWPDSDGRLDG